MFTKIREHRNLTIALDIGAYDLCLNRGKQKLDTSKSLVEGLSQEVCTDGRVSFRPLMRREYR
jgi:hypothetical protein